MTRVYALVLVAACHHGGGAGAGLDAAATTDGAATADARAFLDAPELGAFPAQLVVPAGHATIANPFRVDASGAATSYIGTIAVGGDVGTLQLGGANVGAVTYEREPFAAYTLFQGFAVSASAWHVFWLYCNSGLVDVYDEGIGGPVMMSASASGSCVDGSTTNTSALVDVPALSLATPAPISGYTVSGGAITVENNGTGSLRLAGKTLPLVVFDDVDCTACGTPGWYELHSLVWDAAAQRVTFTIVYLIEGSSGTVELGHSRALPDLADPIGAPQLAATWTANPAAGIVRRTRGIPPPSAIREQL